ncbi:cysteine peptidase family C39 domain-containing protein [Pantanalinema rosaneae CENA516]|uniref:cysteine peptidase family C39 domain-containing protein n=1 Tax=Pantanalinema rosaneae TaxID=1620701 RepID=UPI003D6E1D25
MRLEFIVTMLLGGLAFRWGISVGRVLLRKGATANDLFKGNPLLSVLFLGLYIGLVVLALNVPQLPVLPIEWRVYGMQITWSILRIVLLGFCGLAFIITWKTARLQVAAVALVGLLGLAGFGASESYFLSPIYPELANNLQPNGVFQQTSMSSCAPAALATVLRRWGIEATESSVAKLAGTSRLGTSMPQLIVAARELGMEGAELSPSWEQMQRINRPGVLGVWLISGGRKLPHAVALLAMDNDRAVIGDPARGRIFVLDRQQFAEIWRQEYVPIFRPGDEQLSVDRATNYLKTLGYLSPAAADIQPAIRKFQTAMRVAQTGNLDIKTTLLLTGSFLKAVPTLDTPFGTYSEQESEATIS